MSSQSYVQYGCGRSVGKGWLNLDNSPTLCVELIPIVGPLLGRFASNKNPFPSGPQTEQRAAAVIYIAAWFPARIDDET